LFDTGIRLPSATIVEDARMSTIAIDPIAYTYDEAERVSGLGRSTLKQKIADGELESATFGRRTLIIASSLREMIERHKRPPADFSRGNPWLKPRREGVPTKHVGDT
jgi:excisionase family DNA binding protein